ncbi:MAG: GFA family protein [Candidatus Binataceae bacterium]
MDEPIVMEGACHCGTVRFRVKLTDGLKTARRCNCSYCGMRGAVAVTANLGDIAFEAGEDALTLYQFNTRVAEHYFCSKCGIHTHHRRRSNPNEYSVSAACLKGVRPFDFAEVPVFDGVHHPKDPGSGGTYRIAGYLRYERAVQASKP